MLLVDTISQQILLENRNRRNISQNKLGPSKQVLSCLTFSKGTNILKDQALMKKMPRVEFWSPEAFLQEQLQTFNNQVCTTYSKGPKSDSYI